MTDIIWHRCSMCGERWSGHHQCIPNLPPQPWDSRDGNWKIETAPPQPAEMIALRAEVAKLRAELSAIESSLRTMSRWAVLADREDPSVEAELAMKGLRLWREPTGGES